MVNRRGQIWVETVIYILIALVMIGAVLAFVYPKIEEIQDKLTLDKTVEMLEELDSEIAEVGSSIGNQRVINIEIKKGELKIKPLTTENTITYELKESKVEFSQPTDGPEFIDVGSKVKVRTKRNNDLYDITLKLEFDDSIEYTGGLLTKSSASYKLSISNTGIVGGKAQIGIKLIS
jgi:archaellin